MASVFSPVHGANMYLTSSSVHSRAREGAHSHAITANSTKGNKRITSESSEKLRRIGKSSERKLNKKQKRNTAKNLKPLDTVVFLEFNHKPH
jgi:hypothetical protein